MNAIEELAESFSRLPGIGKKSGYRLASFLLKGPQSFNSLFARQIENLQSRVRPCSVCGAWTENDPCPICQDSGRDRTTICVVEQAQDVTTIDASHEYTGLFHVLGGVISPLDGIGPDKLRIASLIDRVKTGEVKEVILATNPTVEGDTTALYVHKLLMDVRPDLAVTRLASGLPVGGDLEYIDKVTLARSFRGRSKL